MRTSARRGPVFFCYADPAGFSGQRAATETVIRGLHGRGWSIRRLPQPVLERNERSRLGLVRYLLGLGASWARSARLLFARGGWLCVNLGQTRAGMLRDAVPILLGRLGLGRRRVVLSLHGSVFMRWADGSLEIRMFRLLLGNCGIVTALGEGHRERLVSLGYPRERIAVLVNSCEIQPLSQQAFAAKLTAEAGSRGPVRCLHLSSLIDTKGFPEYLEALGALSKADGPRIEAVLCGRLAASEFSGRFGDLAAARRWILERISEINRGSRVRVRWIEGAVGEEKAALFRNADIFVLPTRYAVEAQPLVLLEAMASGCAIITSAAGEIRAILDDSTALFLPNVSARSVESALATLAGDAVLRARLALAAHGRFAADFCLERHLDAWERLLGPNLPIGKASH